MSTADVDGFLARFRRFGAAPGRDTYLALFHPEATLFDSGMERPLTVPEIPLHIDDVLRMVPDFRMVPERWRFHAPTIFVEARNRARGAGEEIFWRSVYCIDLRGDLVIRGRRYYDRRPLFARLAPSLPSLPAFAPDGAGSIARVAEPIGSGEAWTLAWADRRKRGALDELVGAFREDAAFVAPGCARPLSREEVPGWARWLETVVDDLRLEQDAVAGDDSLVFLEWKASGTIGGRPVLFGLVERFDLAAGLALSGRVYFDTLALAAAR